MSKVKLTKSGLIQDLENGLNRSEMSEKYGLNLQQLQKAMRQANLLGRRAKKSVFELIDDTVEMPTIQQVVDAGYSMQQAQEITSYTTPNVY